ncbi:MAG: DUF4111 domain-containing protein [Clostridiales bacterium]|nr:DUF4111 domain-containing protein [Clostridiales bacterium]
MNESACMTQYLKSLPAPQTWETCDDDIRAYINSFVGLLRNILKENLAGVYLHGSLAMGSYFPPKSDMDFIVVTTDKLDYKLAETVNIAIASYAEARPTVGSIECSAITLDTAKNAPRNIPYELHYSEMWHKRVLGGEVKYETEQFDSDLPAHLMCVKKRGICLYGTDINSAFGEISWRNFTESVTEDFCWIVDGENITESPYYGVLNICRVLQILSDNDERYLSKYEGAIWGIKRLPGKYTALIQKALEVYASGKIVSENERKTGGAGWDKSILLAFRDYAKNEAAKLRK